MALERLDRVLRARAEAGRPVAIWLRDDDAVAPTPALDRLLGLAGQGVPLTLAVIPCGTGRALADRLADETCVNVAQHGWSHENHAGPGEKKQELGDHRPLAEVTADLRRGRDHLAALHGPRMLPLLVPPWNRVSPSVTAELPALGFRALSVYGPAKAAPLRVVNTHVDLIDWHGTRGGHPTEVIEAALLAAIDREDTVGLLAHHLVHDAAAWAFLDRLVALTVPHPGATWVAAGALIG